jgi:hypothetical protein
MRRTVQIFDELRQEPGNFIIHAHHPRGVWYTKVSYIIILPELKILQDTYGPIDDPSRSLALPAT